MAGLSVASTLRCEEMWLAWAHGACLVPAPRSLVRSGMDLGPWLVANDVTVVSTVPTLVSLWPTEALAAVRLLILGGEACPPEIGARLATTEREVWNTYGPTEATVVACGARLTGTPPVRIGLPLDGWDLAVVDAQGQPVRPGEPGELIIGGVGLARYLDPEKDAEKYAADADARLGPGLPQRRPGARRPGGPGLHRPGRRPGQARRPADRARRDRQRAARPPRGDAARPRPCAARAPATSCSSATSRSTTPSTSRPRCPGCARRCPAALVPRLAVVDDLPTRTSGKIDRDALPWPLPSASTGERRPADGHGRLARRTLWRDVLGAAAEAGDDFFDLGGGSLTAAQLVARLRERFPEVTVADVYEHPRLADLAAALDQMAPRSRAEPTGPAVPVKTQAGQIASTVPLRTLSGLRWLTWLGVGTNVAAGVLDLAWLPRVSWWWVALGWLAPGLPARTDARLGASGARLLLRQVGPGAYPRGGKVHLRLWLAERIADECGAANLAGAPLMRVYARALGAEVGKHVDLHAIPPVTGLLTLGDGCSDRARGRPARPLARR